jgi:hypothetical protein
LEDPEALAFDELPRQFVGYGGALLGRQLRAALGGEGDDGHGRLADGLGRESGWTAADDAHQGDSGQGVQVAFHRVLHPWRA